MLKNIFNSSLLHATHSNTTKFCLIKFHNIFLICLLFYFYSHDSPFTKLHWRSQLIITSEQDNCNYVLAWLSIIHISPSNPVSRPLDRSGLPFLDLSDLLSTHSPSDSLPSALLAFLQVLNHAERAPRVSAPVFPLPGMQVS